MKIWLQKSARLTIGALLISTMPVFAHSDISEQPAPPEVTEGPCHVVQIVAGPFDIHRRYGSMEGPWVAAKFSIGDIVFSRHVEIAENKVHFVENNNEVPPQMNGFHESAGNGAGMANSQLNPAEELDGLVDTSKLPPSLYWFKGMKVEVLDESGNPMPKGEFICHSNIETMPDSHNQLFPQGEKWMQSRLVTITQGQTSVMLPSGFAIPCSSDEVWRLSLQAANRITDQHRRIKQRATFYFIKDSELVYPVTAIYSRSHYVSLIIDKDSEEGRLAERKKFPHCDAMATVVNAPNNVIGGTNEDKFGRRRSGHWVVPPGLHTYSSVIGEEDQHFADKPRKVQAAWVHVHPLCEHVALTQCSGAKDAANNDSNKRKEFFTADISTAAEAGLTITKIQPNIPEGGVLLPKGIRYQLTGRYNNTLPRAIDSMISVGLYIEDRTFARPMWALPDHKADYCGIKSCPVNVNATSPESKSVSNTEYLPAENNPAHQTSGLRPLFNAKLDGPLLKDPLRLKLITTSGDIEIVLDPSIAPCTASQMAKLFQSGAFDATRLVRHTPGFYLQVGAAEDKSLNASLKRDSYSLLRRLPLETSDDKNAQHSKYSLSMSRDPADENSAISSFTILLCDAPHMNGKYTVFGHLANDDQTLATIQRITSDWDAERPTIVEVKAAKSVATASKRN